MYKKFSVLALFLGLLGLFQACFCGDFKPFFDYQSVHVAQIQLNNDTVSAAGVLQVSPAGLQFLASAYLPLISSGPLYGTSCPQDGEDGPKHALTQLEIFADQPFNDTLPAGASLSGLFYDRFSGSAQPITQSGGLSDFTFPEASLVLYTPFAPQDTSQTFTLTVRITKADGSVAEGSVTGVEFQ